MYQNLKTVEKIWSCQSSADRKKWVGRWVDLKAVLWIVYSNKKLSLCSTFYVFISPSQWAAFVSWPSQCMLSQISTMQNNCLWCEIIAVEEFRNYPYNLFFTKSYKTMQHRPLFETNCYVLEMAINI
jgi:hypothetical protein